MIIISNSLSFLRAPLAFLFLNENPSVRILAILLAMISDSIDGYLARRSRSTSRFGAIFDPAMDKFFVYFGMGVLFMEGRMAPWEMAAMLSRDFSLCIYGLFMIAAGRRKAILFRSIRWGKISTTLQFIILMSLVWSLSVPWYLYVCFIGMGWLALIELLYTPSQTSKA